MFGYEDLAFPVAPEGLTKEQERRYYEDLAKGQIIALKWSLGICAVLYVLAYPFIM